MTSDDKRKIVIPCSGIGKVHGLLSREAVYELVEQQHPEGFDTLCLALLVVGDPGAKTKIAKHLCITVDGCPRACAKKNVELAGGTVERAVWVVDALKRHRGSNAGTATSLTGEGWAIAGEIADDIATGCSESEREE